MEINYLRKTFFSDISELEKFLDFLEKQIFHVKDKRCKNSILISCEEFFINICKYAYSDKNKKIYIELFCNNKIFEIIFIDSGVDFNPLLFNKKLSIGGNGILIAKRLVDKIEYLRVKNKNVLKLRKILRK